MRVNFNRLHWEDFPSAETPLSAANLNRLEEGVAGLYSDVSEMQQTVTDLGNTVRDLGGDDVSQKTVTFLTQSAPTPMLSGDTLEVLMSKIQAYLTHGRSYVGMIIYSTTLDTEAKVKAQYGGEHWIQHTGYFLYAGNTGVSANNATADGGEPMHMLTVDEMPSHRHGLINELQPPSYNYGCVVASGSVSNSSIGSSGATQNTNYAGGGQPHNNMPPYKRTFVWERTE